MILLGRKHLRGRWDDWRGIRVFSRVSRHTPTNCVPLVLVHGLGVSSRYMTPLASEWANEYRAYVPDLPGHGRSGKPKRVLTVPELAGALRDWLDTVGIPRAAFVGNSMGCQILVELAHLDPGRMLAACFLGPTMDDTVPSRWAHVWRLLKDQFHEPLTLVPLQAFDYLGNGPIRTVQTFLAAVKHGMRTRVSAVTVPCLIMRGENDTIVSQQWLQALANSMPCAAVEVVPGAGHALNFNSAAVIAPRILAFWRDRGVDLERDHE